MKMMMLLILLVIGGGVLGDSMSKTQPPEELAVEVESANVVIVEPTASPSATPKPTIKPRPKVQQASGGRVTWYGASEGECSGCRRRADGKFHTATGEVLDDNAMTCASNMHKMGTLVKITHVGSGETATCRVNDTGGFGYPTLLDVTKAVANALGGLHTHQVTIEVIK